LTLKYYRNGFKSQIILLQLAAKHNRSCDDAPNYLEEKLSIDKH